MGLGGAAAGTAPPLGMVTVKAPAPTLHDITGMGPNPGRTPAYVVTGRSMRTTKLAVQSPLAARGPQAVDSPAVLLASKQITFRPPWRRSV